MAPLSCWPNAQSEGAGEAECERSRGSDPGLGGRGTFWHPKSQGILASSPRRSPNVARGGRSGRDQPVHAAI